MRFESVLIWLACQDLSDCVVFVANSSAVRLVDKIRLSGFVFSNRGASGIDGIVSTALGMGAGFKKHVVLLIGDLALLHDLNGLLLLKESGISISVVVLNDDGGGIFSGLPVSNVAYFDRFFRTPHGRSFKGLADMMGISYKSVVCVTELSDYCLDLGTSVILDVCYDYTNENI